MVVNAFIYATYYSMCTTYVVFVGASIKQVLKKYLGMMVELFMRYANHNHGDGHQILINSVG